MNVVFTWDFYAITLVTILAPMLCFIVGTLEDATAPLQVSGA